MSNPSRRTFLHSCLATAALSRCRPAFAAAATPLPVIGAVRPRGAAAIAASPFSVGMETLDRKMFDPPRVYPHVAKLGVKWVRLHTGWCRTEIQRGRYDFAWLDAVVDSLLKLGLQPWFCVGFGNRLYMPDAPDEYAVGWNPAATPLAREGWLRYVAALAEHYRTRVRHYEIWNEPNGHTFWKPGKPNPAEYVDLVKVTAPVIRQRIDNAVIVGGAITGMETKFFQAAMDAGLAPHIDKVSFHSYRFLPETNYERDVNQWREIIARHKPSLALWHGEVGAASQPGGAGGHADHPWTELRQAKWLTRRFLSDLRMKIELISCFHAVDLVNYRTSEGPSTKTNFKGLLRGTDYTPKPSYYAVQCLCALFDAQTARLDLPIDFPGALPANEIVSATFTRGGKALYAYWHPAGKEMERDEQRITLKLATRPDAQLTTPVLIEPLNGKIHRLDSAQRSGDQWTIADLPLADHPLILTDQSIALP